MKKKSLSTSSQSGVLLLELLIVLMIIGLLITGAVKTWDVTIQQTRFTQTTKEMDQLVYAIVGNPELYSEGRRTDFGYVGDMGKLPDSLIDLVIRPSSDDSTWHGPYIKVKFAENPDDYLKDAWGNNYIYINREDSSFDSLMIISYTTGNNLTPQTWIHRIIAKSRHDLLYDTVNGYVRDLLGNPPATIDTSNLIVGIFSPYPTYSGSVMWFEATVPDQMVIMN